MSLQDELVRMGAPGTVQDINDPVWPSMPVTPDETVIPVDLEHGHELRTIRGPLDLLQHVEEEIADVFEHHSEHDEEQRFLKQAAKVLAVANVLANSWRGVTFSIAACTRIVPKRDDRMRVLVTNTSAAVVTLSHESVNPGSPGVITLAAGATREFKTAGEIWVSPNVLGTAQTVDIQDEYGVPLWQ